MAVNPRLVLAAVVVVAVVGIAGSWTALSLCVALLALLVAVDLALAPRPREVGLSRRPSRTSTRLGETVTVVVDVVNEGHREVRGQLRDAWPPSAGAAGERHDLAVPPGERRSYRTTLAPTRRGRRSSDRVTVRMDGPLHLAARQRSVALPCDVDVLPPFRSRRHLPSRLARLRDLEGRTAVLVRGQGTEFDSLREYVDGDDVRSIDWRATARTADVMVRTWRPERDRRVLLVVDSGRTSAGRVGDEPRIDAAMEAALLLGALATRAGDRVDLLVWDRGVRAAVQGESGAGLLTAMTRTLAFVEASLVETDWRGLASEVLRRERQRALVVLLTAVEDAPLTEGLLPVLPHLTARHLVVVAGAADPEVAKLASGRGSAPAVYAAAAAARSEQGRRRISEQLARRGVEVVDALPDALAPALADRYLALKAAGRL
jgi:uncharacterized protein (DUF58 family)